MALFDTPTPFSRTQFLTDFKKTADAIDAPYSESSIQGILDTFQECFEDSAVIWRTTNRPNDVLNYRFYLQRRLDTVEIATKAGHIEPDNQMSRLASSWSNLNDGNTQQWCDFHPRTGLAKTWVNLRCQYSLNNVLDAPEVPTSVRAHGTILHRLGLDKVRFLAVDYDSCTMNLYFTAPGPISKTQAEEYTKLAHCSPPTELELQDMRDFLHKDGFAFAVTMDYSTGDIKRVAFYALHLPDGKMPTVNDRIKKFFAEAPGYDKEATRNIAWSYGIGDSKYMKAEASYVGELANVLANVGSPVTKS